MITHLAIVKRMFGNFVKDYRRKKTSTFSLLQQYLSPTLVAQSHSGARSQDGAQRRWCLVLYFLVLSFICNRWLFGTIMLSWRTLVMILP